MFLRTLGAQFRPLLIFVTGDCCGVVSVVCPWRCPMWLPDFQRLFSERLAIYEPSGFQRNGAGDVHRFAGHGVVASGAGSLLLRPCGQLIDARACEWTDVSVRLMFAANRALGFHSVRPDHPDWKGFGNNPTVQEYLRPSSEHRGFFESGPAPSRFSRRVRFWTYARGTTAGFLATMIEPARRTSGYHNVLMAYYPTLLQQLPPLTTRRCRQLQRQHQLRGKRWRSSPPLVIPEMLGFRLILIRRNRGYSNACSGLFFSLR